MSLPSVPSAPLSFALADDPRPTLELSPIERSGRLSENWADYERTANPRTLRTYQAGVAKLVAWMDKQGLAYTFPADPVSPRTLAAWIDDRGENLKPASARNYLSGINKMHVLAGWPAPSKAIAVENATKRLVMDTKAPQRQALPLRWESIRCALGGMSDSLIDLRDAALVCLAFDTLARASELVALNVSDFREGPNGYSVWIARSKTDQSGDGQFRFVSDEAAQRLTAWIEAATLEQDAAIFIPLSTVQTDAPADRISPRDVSRIYKRRCGAEYSAHSTRVGGAVAQREAGIDSGLIMASGGWKSPVMVARYTKEADAQRSGAAQLARLQGRTWAGREM